MKRAGVKVWVLTGDKIETAMNIGYSAGLLDNKMEKYIVDETEKTPLRDRLDKVRYMCENPSNSQVK